MCGISGYVNYEDDLSESFSTLKEMCKTLEKRGNTIMYEKKYHRFNAGKTDNATVVEQLP